MGFPGKSIDDLELIEDEEEENESDDNVEEDGDEEPNDDDEDEEEFTDEEVEQDSDEKASDEEAAEVADEDEESEIHLDPRAGRVDVFIAEIPFEPQEIIDIFEEIKYKEFTNVKTRQIISKIVNQLVNFAYLTDIFH